MVSPLSGLNLQGAPDQTLNSVLAGRQAYERSQLNNQVLQQGQQQIAKSDYDQATQRLSVINKLAVKAKSLGPQERNAFVQSINPEMLKSVGIDPAQISSVQLDDNSLDALIAQTSAALPSSPYRKESVSTDQGLQVFDPATGTYKAATGADGKPLTGAAYDPAIAGEIARRKALATGGVDLGIKPEITRRQAQAEADVELSTRPGITAATTTADINAKSGAEAKSALPKVEAAADRSMSLIDELVSHPGRDMATGSTAWVPAIPGTKQADFINRFDQVKGQAFLQAFESLKGAGAITDQEGKAASQAFARLNRATSRAEFDDAADELKSAITDLRDIAKNKASQGGSGKSGATPGINSEAKTVNWNDL